MPKIYKIVHAEFMFIIHRHIKIRISRSSSRLVTAFKLSVKYNFALSPCYYMVYREFAVNKRRMFHDLPLSDAVATTLLLPTVAILVLLMVAI